MDNHSQHTRTIKKIAKELGFADCGIAQARMLSEEESRLNDWLNKGFHGNMDYMANHFEKRLDPQKLVPGAKSIISLIYNYYPENDLGYNSEYKIAKYAYGKDYHFVIKDKLKIFLDRIKVEIGDVNGRAFVDSAPVMERQWAQLAGLGWLGKNGLLLNKKMGSFFFIAELIIDLDLNYDSPVMDHCGSCTRCIEACPTDAIVEPGVVDGSKCISYYTIELKADQPIESNKDFEGWVFGCDICQDVCPWNRFSIPHEETEFKPTEKLIKMNSQDWQEITQEVFSSLFSKSAVKRTKLKGLKRNIAYTKENSDQG